MKRIWSIMFLFVLIIKIFPQDFIVAPDRVNVLYYGIRNPLKTIVENHDCKSIRVFTDNGKIEGNSCDLNIIPAEVGPAEIVVNVINASDTVLIGKTYFRIEYVPDPVVKIAGKEGGLIEKNVLLGQYVIIAELIDFDFDIKFKIESFSVIIVSDKNIIYKHDFIGNTLNTEFKTVIKDARPKYIVRFESIIAVGEDGTSRLLKPLKYIIR